MPKNAENPLVSIGMGSKSDRDIVAKAVKVLRTFDIPIEVKVKSAHRTPERMAEYASELGPRGVKLAILVAGGSAHLPGMVEAFGKVVPCLAVPVFRPERGHGDEAKKSSDSMPPGIPLAVFPNNAADRAALFAVQMLGVYDSDLRRKYERYHQDLHDGVIADNDLLEELGFEEWDEMLNQQEAGTA